jgi:hypothetical protein
MKSARLQVDPGLVSALLAGSSALRNTLRPPPVPAGSAAGTAVASASAVPAGGNGAAAIGEGVRVNVREGRTLNAVAQDVERQYLLALFGASNGSFATLAETLLGDKSRTRAIRLRFNQLGIKIRALRNP